jgi:hypothetical protein
MKLSAPAPAPTQATEPVDADSGEVGGAAREWSPGETLLNDYVVERVLGAGGMGKVYLARSQITGEPFAVKTTHLVDARRRQLLFNELRTWIGLPRHPHLTACRFFKTVGDQVGIFAEYVDGGSLADALDAAAHVWGLIHRDVKPANVLLQKVGSAGFRAKVADFGISSGRDRANVARSEPARGGPASAGGMTNAYRSPEQAEGKPLTPKTDMWSWGVSALALFCGGAHWLLGEAAPEVLDEYAQDSTGQARPVLSAGVIRVLRKCFRRDPSERWSDMSAVAAEMAQAYREMTGQPYPRTTPSFEARAVNHGAALDFLRESHDARHWLGVALVAAGRDPLEAEKWLTESRSIDGAQAAQAAQLVEELRALDEAARILEGLVATGHTEHEETLARLRLDAALLYRVAGDHAGAFDQLDRALHVCERRGTAPNRPGAGNSHSCAPIWKRPALCPWTAACRRHPPFLIMPSTCCWRVGPAPPIRMRRSPPTVISARCFCTRAWLPINSATTFPPRACSAAPSSSLKSWQPRRRASPSSTC